MISQSTMEVTMMVMGNKTSWLALDIMIIKMMMLWPN